MAHLTGLDDAAWDSPWRTLRCVDKVALSLGLVVVALVTPAWPGSVLVAATALVVTLGPARIPARVLAGAMAAPAFFITIGVVSVALQIGVPPGPALWHWGVFSVTPESAGQAGTVLGHALSGTLALMLLGTTTPLVDLLTWLRVLRVPAPLLEIASLTYRLIFVVLSSGLAVLAAQHQRLGYERGPGRRGWRRPWVATAQAISLIFLHAWNRAIRLAEGLELRGEADNLMTTAAPAQTSRTLRTSAIVLPLGIFAVAVVAR